MSSGAKRRHSSFWFYVLSKTYIAIAIHRISGATLCATSLILIDIAICGVLRTPQMAENGKNRLAILTIFCFRRTDVYLGREYLQRFALNPKLRKKIESVALQRFQFFSCGSFDR
ncbi:hypothetical protein VB774_18070 [Pseudanabaena galeata UHCC 0370]|uniref:Uncharacterized protein n=1 Tax=Pseudanabaena galeata UHCC 0370 TaxID=3110310 RepID=A0ABU5TMJ8_9CYAN|nr:hypothetical protein [Pseudanabaena galeata]MEA5479531.1 hypothetical protein [Pseudanabaena galeata UHCC 0370]